MLNFRTYQLALQFHRSAALANVAAHLKSQLMRAASSAALNLSEGYGKQYMRDRVKYFSIAMGSIRECQAVVDLEPQGFTSEARQHLDHLAASTWKLIAHSRKRP